jgi:hypothetical protein
MIRACVRGQVSEALRITALPQAKRHGNGAHAEDDRRIPRRNAQTMTPTGSFSAMARQPGLSEGMTSPAIWVVMRSGLAHHASCQIEVEHRPARSNRFRPSSHRQRHRPSRFQRAAAFISTARRAFGPCAAQAGKQRRRARRLREYHRPSSPWLWRQRHPSSG